MRTLDINKVLGYATARFGGAGIAFSGKGNLDISQVQYWHKRTAEHFGMDEDHEDIEILHSNYKNYTATQMREFIKTLK